MEKGFIWKKKLRQGFFCKRAKGGGVSLRNKREGRGFWAKSPLFFLHPPGRNRGRGLGRRRCQSRQPGARGCLRSEGEGREGPARSIPGRSLGGGGPGWPGLDGWWQRATVAPDRCPRGAAAVKERGRSTSGPLECQNLPLIGPRGSGKGSSAVTGARGGGDGGWRCWEIGKAVVERRGGAGGLL